MNELDEHSFLSELLSARRDPWDMSFSSLLGADDSPAPLYDPCCFFEEPTLAYPANAPVAPLLSGHNFDCFVPAPLVGPVSAFPTAVGPDIHSPCSTSTTSSAGGVFYPLAFARDDCRHELEVEDLSPLIRGGFMSLVGGHEPAFRKIDGLPDQGSAALDVGSSPADSHAGKARAKRLDGQPSKNLMAERRRRKRLNDRLSMLRSIVPKISKMDRTSILGDTIDYMRELLDRIQAVREEMAEKGGGASPSGGKLLRILEDYETVVRNTPKFNVERRETETWVELSCAARAGLLLSTVHTLQALGLDVRHCVVSCFNDFGLRATCSEGAKQGDQMISTEEIKQALFRNAGYGGRCA